MAMEPTHIDGVVHDLILTYLPELAGVRVGSPVGTSDNSAVFIVLCWSSLFFTWCVGRGSI